MSDDGQGLVMWQRQAPFAPSWSAGGTGGGAGVGREDGGGGGGYNGFRPTAPLFVPEQASRMEFATDIIHEDENGLLAKANTSIQFPFASRSGVSRFERSMYCIYITSERNECYYCIDNMPRVCSLVSG